MGPYTPKENERILRADGSPYFYPQLTFQTPRNAKEEREQDALILTRSREHAELTAATHEHNRLADWPPEAVRVLELAERALAKSRPAAKGQNRDSLGRRYCTDDNSGKRVPCAGGATGEGGSRTGGEHAGASSPKITPKPALSAMWDTLDRLTGGKLGPSKAELRNREEKRQVTARYTEKLAATRVREREEIPGKEITDAQPLQHSGLNVSRKVVFSDGTAGVYKPVAGEAEQHKGTYQEGTQAQREVATSAAAAVMGVADLVPATNWSPDKVASMQMFVEGTRPRFATDLKLIPVELRTKVTAFDFVIGNKDRHAGNWFWDEGSGVKYSHVALIDNGLAFPDSENARHWQYGGHGWPKAAVNDPIPDIVGEWSENREEIAAVLKREGLSDGAVGGFLNRLEALEKVRQAGGTFKDVTWTTDQGDAMNWQEMSGNA